MKEEWHPCVHDVVDDLPLTKRVWELRKSDSRRFHAPAHKGRGHFLAEILDIRCDESGVYEQKKGIPFLERTLATAFGGRESRLFGNKTEALAISLKTLSCKSVALYKNTPKSVFSALTLLEIEPIIIDCISDEEIRACVNSAQAVIISSPDLFLEEEKAEKLQSISKELKKSVLTVSGFCDIAKAKTAAKNSDIAVFCLDGMIPCFSGSTAVVSYSDKAAERLSLFESEIAPQTAMSVEYGMFVEESYKDAKEELKKNVEKLKNILLSSDFELDETSFTTLSINTRRMGISGKELEMRLNDMGIFVQYADVERVILTFSVEDEKEELTSLTRDLIIAAEQCGAVSEKAYKSVGNLQREKGYIESVYGESETVDVEEAENRIVANNISLHGGERVVILAGEKITKNAIEYLEEPLDFEGIEKNGIKVLK